jgi:gas vesicle protein
MDEEQAPIEETPVAEALDEVAASLERSNAGGPGLLLGLLAGAFAGAIIALLLAPKPGEQVTVPPPEAVPADPAARLAAVLARVRHLMQEASLEAHQAAQETEERLRERYSQLTSRRDGA